MVEKVREIAPGMFLRGKVITLCPACGLKSMGGDANDRTDVLAWLMAVLMLMESRGVKNANPADAAQMTKEWFDGASSYHKEGGHDVNRN